MNSITRKTWSTIAEHKLYCLSIYGLCILNSDELHLPFRDDPRVVFMSALTSSFRSMAHLGGLVLKDIDDDGALLLSLYPDYIQTGVGVYGGTFYMMDPKETPQSYILPHLSRDILQHQDVAVNDMIETVLYSDALALYVGCAERREDILALARSTGSISHVEWLTSVAELCTFILMTGGDDSNFDVYSRRQTEFDLILPFIEIAETKVRETDWYKENAARLTWNENAQQLVL